MECRLVERNGSIEVTLCKPCTKTEADALLEVYNRASLIFCEDNSDARHRGYLIHDVALTMGIGPSDTLVEITLYPCGKDTALAAIAYAPGVVDPAAFLELLREVEQLCGPQN